MLTDLIMQFRVIRGYVNVKYLIFFVFIIALFNFNDIMVQNISYNLTYSNECHSAR